MKGPAAILLTVLLLPGSGGCGASGPRESPPLVPEPARARAALELALGGWAERGERQGELGGVRVELVDRRRAEGRHPGAFDVLGTVREDWGRGFVVRLTWDGEEEEMTTYVVAGADPIWVMRKDDIDLLMHWEHPMDPRAPDDPAAGEAEASEEGS